MKKSTLTTLLIGIASLIACCFFTDGHALNNDGTEVVHGK